MYKKQKHFFTRTLQLLLQETCYICTGTECSRNSSGEFPMLPVNVYKEEIHRFDFGDNKMIETY